MIFSIDFMRNIVVILFGILFLVASCNEDNQQGVSVRPVGLTKSFSIIIKDSSSLMNYQFKKDYLHSGGIVFSYRSDGDSFDLLCDTSRKLYRAVFDKDTVNLDLEAEKTYIVNGYPFHLIKAVRDKGVTDGEVSYFLESNYGLLISRSNTWRNARIINPEGAGKNYVELTALLYRILTDEDVFKNPVPDSGLNFTVPRVE